MADIDIQWSETGLGFLTLAVEEFTGDVVDDIVSTMRRLVPVDTGVLHDSIESVHEGLHGLIAVGTDYWPYVEYGTSQMAAQPFIRPALYRSR